MFLLRCTINIIASMLARRVATESPHQFFLHMLQLGEAGGGGAIAFGLGSAGGHNRSLPKCAYC
jgi:hypothetical protein